MRREFVASFGSYVNDGGDVRKRILEPICGMSPASILEGSLLLVCDLAALMTCAVYVDPNSSAAKDLLSRYEVYKQKCQEAEDRFEDPEQIEFNPGFADLEIVLNPDVPELKTFMETFCTVKYGRTFLGKVFVCLIWAHGIKTMIPNKPKIGGVKCSLKL
ncbi:hypothetical protein HYV70_03920 [Candidatus Uhrbacteria bacterium]|nr:hypothetical protein [Candidatus Uhrbacteria bacterium]